MAYDPRDEDAARLRGLSTAQLRDIQRRLGLSNQKISELPESRLARLLGKLQFPDRPRLRAGFDALFERTEDRPPTGEEKMRCFAQLERSRTSPATKARVAGVPSGARAVAAELSPPPLPEAAGLDASGAGWTSLGPGRVGGRTRSIVVDPRDAQRIWVGSVGGGAWLTTDGGQSWFPVDDRMANLAVSCLAMSPTDPDTLFAGTGEGWFNLDALRGAGIFRTTDGTHWSHLASTTGPDFHYVNRLALSADGQVLLAATQTGLHRSVDAQRQTWANVLPDDVADVRCHPTDPLLAVAATRASGQLLFSTDGGASWTPALTPHVVDGRIEVTYAAADPQTVYASVEHDGGRIWRSTDGGHSYLARAASDAGAGAVDFLGEQGWYDNAVWAGDPDDADLVIVGGVDLWRSFDGGDTLARISDWTESASAHADHHAIVSHPDYGTGGNRTVFFGNDGGIHRTDDVHTVGSDAASVNGWVNLVNGYAVTQFYGGAGNTTSGVIVGGAQDNGTLAFSPAGGVNGWVEILGGDGGYCAADANDPQVFYQEYVYLMLHRNTNGASSDADWWKGYICGYFWNPLLPGWDWKPLPFRIPDAGTPGGALFIAPFVLDPNDSDRILAGGRSLWRTNDARTANTNASGPSWASVKPSIGNPISAIAIAAGDSDLVWVGHANGRLYRTHDALAAAPQWQLVSHQPGSPLQPARMCTRVTVDPADLQRVYATFAGYQAGNLWVTPDDGATWQDLSTALPQTPMRALAIHPRRPQLLYLGTEVGVFTSEDSGATWSPTNEGPTSCAVSDLFWMDEVLVCVTHGRGMFSIDLSGV